MIVFSAAILIFRPGAAPASTSLAASAGSSRRSATTDPAELARDEAFRGLLNPTAISPVQENYINIYGDADMTVDSRNDSSKTVINVPKPSAPAVPETKPASAARPAQPRAAAPVQAKPAASETVKSAQRNYWVQAGSFSTKDRAEGVKGTLDTKGISAIVTNQVINGDMYFRVRAGPYTSQNEANYWLSMIKSIDGFQDSQIWESQSVR